MGKIAWNNRFRLHIPDIDERNMQFVEKINGLIETIQKEKDLLRIKTLLTDFADEVNRHFRHEEMYLRDKLGGIAYSDHKNRHLFFEDFLRKPLLKSSGDDQTNMQELSQELSDFLADWVAFHIQHLDKNDFCS